ncbi:hypothetical protein ACNS7O_10685 [Haloferacaceae archaeon DSL9]
MTDDKNESEGAQTLLPGLAAVVLFGVLMAAFINAAPAFGSSAGFPAGESIVHNIGYALFDLNLGEIASEGFLAAFLIIALGLDVAIDSALYLAKREEEGEIVAVLADGGREIADAVRDGGSK